MSFTARHYNSIQTILRDARSMKLHDAMPGPTSAQDGYHSAARDIQERIGRMLAADNPRFDLTRYNKECEPK